MKKILIITISFLFSFQVQATVHTVTSSSDNKQTPTSGMLRYYIENASDGDTIIFNVSNVILDTTLRINGGILTIDGGDGVDIDGNNNSSVFNISSYSSDNITIRNLTIKNGYLEKASAMGGGMYAYVFSGELLVENCTFEDNNIVASSDGQGGGVRTNGGTFQNCYFLNNQVSGIGSTLGGGGVYASGGTFVNCVFSGNDSKYGGGIYASETTILNCTFTQNKVSFVDGGGGISCENGTTTTNSIIFNNTANGANNNIDAYNSTFSYCAIESSNSLVGTNNNIGLIESPFKHSGADSLSIKEGSLCIDSATDTITGLANYDISGYNRIIGLGPDIGAYEFHESYLMSESTIYTDGGVFYDSGGENENYLRESYTTTFYPATDGEVLQFIFEEFETSNWTQYLEIYDGPSTKSPIIGVYKNDVGPNTITASNADGALTFRFTISTGLLTSGWKAIIRSITPVLSTLPTAYFISDTTSTSTPLSVQFNNYSGNNPESWHWDFGDGSTSTEYNPVYDYAETGIYFVTLIVTNSLGTDTIIRSVKTADVDDYLMSDQEITTDLAMFYDSGGELNNHSAGGDYTMTYSPSSADKVIQVAFEYFHTTEYIYTPDLYLRIYDGLSTDSPLIGEYMGICDIGTITATNADGALTFRFISHEIYTTQKGWKAAIYSVERSLGNAPVAHFSFDTVLLTEPLSVKLIENSRFNPTAWEWNFGDETISADRNPVHTYSQTGIYYVTLIATNDFGSDTIIKSIKTADVNDYIMADTSYTSDLGYFYDSGGEDYVYMPDEDYTVTFQPATADYGLQFIFEEFETGSWTHYLEIFDGLSTDAPEMSDLFEYSETNSPGTVIASNSDGALTFRFSSNFSGNVYPGWKASFSSLPYYNLNFTINENGSLLGDLSQTIMETHSSKEITASSDVGFHFIEWQNTTGDSITSENPLIITNVNKDSTLTAIFGINNYNASFITTENGSLSGITEQNITHGSNSTTVNAIPNNHYHFLEWRNASGDSITNENPLVLTKIISDTTLAAFYAIDSYNLTVIAAENGYLSGTTEQSIDHGSTATAVTAIADNHYHFLEWRNANGDSITNENPLVINTVVSDTTLTAVFEINNYKITFSQNGGGVINGITQQEVAYNNDAIAIEAIPNTGYYFSEWQNEIEESVTVQNPLTINAVYSDSSLIAIFKKYSYDISFSAAQYGSLNGLSQQIIEHGNNASEIEAISDVGYHFVMWQNQSGDSITNINPLLLVNIENDTSLTAIFKIDPTPNITATTLLNNSKVKLYPTIINDYFLIESDENYKLSIISIKGVDIFQKEIISGHNYIDTNHLPKGTYIIKLHNKNTVRIIQIIKE